MSEAAPVVRIVDDDLSFLNALSRLLRAAGFCVHAFPSAERLLEELHPEIPGCVLADLRMPGVNGLELQDVLARYGGSLPIVFLSGHGTISAAVRAMRAGAEDFLTKTTPREELLGAVQRALDRDAVARQFRAHQDELQARLATLTPREREVLLHVVSGKPNKQIAGDLGIHERTVKLHRTGITSKLGVHSVAELTRMSHEAGLLPSRSTSP
jgi:FixJ family two-component response regulator